MRPKIEVNPRIITKEQLYNVNFRLQRLESCLGAIADTLEKLAKLARSEVSKPPAG